MEITEIIKDIKKNVIEDDLKMYTEIFNSNEIGNDPIWKEIIPIYNNLSITNKSSFINFIKLIQVNTVSHIFGILDGSSYLNEKNEDFLLITKSNNKIINGDLQDIFLELEENGDFN